MRLLGIDFGDKKIGISISDETGTFAFPKEVIENNESAISKIATLVLESRIDKIIFGLSQNSQGEENPIMKIARVFADELKKITEKEVLFQNEAFSSVHARIDSEKNIDASAAAIILQRYIDSHGNN